MKGAHFLEEDPGLFDAAFFSYSAETASVSPSQHPARFPMLKGRYT